MSSPLTQLPSLMKEVLSFCWVELGQSMWRTGGTTLSTRATNLRIRLVIYIPQQFEISFLGDSLVLENCSFLWGRDEAQTATVCHRHIKGSHEWLCSELNPKNFVFSRFQFWNTFFCRSCMDQTDHRSFALNAPVVKIAFQWPTLVSTGSIRNYTRHQDWSK